MDQLDIGETRQPRKPGSARGQVWMAEDFEETPEDLKDYLAPEPSPPAPLPAAHPDPRERGGR